MPNLKPVFAAALSAFLLASCGSRAPTAANEAAEAPTNGLEQAGPSDPGQPSGSAGPGADPVPPPDAVSHPDGYLPPAGDPPAPSAPEPGTESGPGSREPATEDEYIRNKQAGG